LGIQDTDLAETKALLAAAFPGFAPPKILLLYGSLRERSFSRLLTQAAAQVLTELGAQVEIFDPRGLPMPDAVGPDDPKVAELRRLSIWSEGQVWCSPERHGAITAVMKAHLDWIPLQVGDVWPTQGRTLAVLQVNGGRHSFNGVNALRLLGRAARMIVVPNQLSIPEASKQFDADGALLSAEFRARLVDVMEELMKITLLTRGRGAMLLDRHSEREAAKARPAT
jgi:arsenic resistance protein ArsH